VSQVRLLLRFFYPVLHKDVETSVFVRMSSEATKFLLEPYEALHLEESEKYRRSVLEYELPLDDAFLKRMGREARASINAGKRMGREWVPCDGKDIVPKTEADQAWADHTHLRLLNDVCTKWCTEKYFPNATARVNMVINVTRLYDRLATLNPTCKFRILFKGGVMIRLLLLEFCNSLLHARLRAKDFMRHNKILSMSDFDFEISLQDHDASDDTIHRFLAMDYAVLLHLQERMQVEIEKHRPGLLFLDWDAASGIETLRAYLQEAVDGVDDEAHAFYKATIDYVFLGDTPDRPPKGYLTSDGAATPAPRANVFIFRHGAVASVLAAEDGFRALGFTGVPTRSGGRCLYATCNSYIGETNDTTPTNPEFRRDVFHLARIKHAFVVYYTTRSKEKRCDRLGGEMIDLSQSHSLRLDEGKRALYQTVATPYRDYPIIAVPGVRLHSYTIEGFVFDHMAMLHHTDIPCFEAKKVEKRLARYVSFLVAHVTGPLVKGTSSQKMRALEHFRDKTASLAALLEMSTRTGILSVDHAITRERTSLQSAPRAKGAAYLRVLHGHLRSLCALLRQAAEPQRAPELDPNILLNLQRFIFRTPTASEYRNFETDDQLQRVVDQQVYDLRPNHFEKGLEMSAAVHDFCLKFNLRSALAAAATVEWEVVNALSAHVQNAPRAWAINQLVKCNALRSPICAEKPKDVHYDYGAYTCNVDACGKAVNTKEFATRMRTLLPAIEFIFDDSFRVELRDSLRQKTHLSVAVGGLTHRRVSKIDRMNPNRLRFSYYDMVNPLDSSSAFCIQTAEAEDEPDVHYFEINLPVKCGTHVVLVHVVRIAVRSGQDCHQIVRHSNGLRTYSLHCVAEREWGEGGLLCILLLFHLLNIKVSLLDARQLVATVIQKNRNRYTRLSQKILDIVCTALQLSNVPSVITFVNPVTME
jgi:hypothetical protein